LLDLLVERLVRETLTPELSAAPHLVHAEPQPESLGRAPNGNTNSSTSEPH
jgi:hypothetical protein